MKAARSTGRSWGTRSCPSSSRLSRQGKDDCPSHRYLPKSSAQQSGGVAQRAEIGFPVNTLTLKGKVFTGEGNGKKFVSLPWVKRQIEENLGFTPFLGTLNLKLTSQSASLRKQLENADPIKIYPTTGYCVGLLFKAFIGKEKCAVILPQIKDYPENVLEIIAPVNLRTMLSLNDDDSLVVTVQA